MPVAALLTLLEECLHDDLWVIAVHQQQLDHLRVESHQGCVLKAAATGLPRHPLGCKTGSWAAKLTQTASQAPLLTHLCSQNRAMVFAAAMYLVVSLPAFFRVLKRTCTRGKPVNSMVNRMFSSVTAASSPP